MQNVFLEGSAPTTNLCLSWNDIILHKHLMMMIWQKVLTYLWLESSGIQSLIPVFSGLNFINPAPQAAVTAKQSVMYKKGCEEMLFP